MNLSTGHTEKTDDRLRLALLQADDGDLLCAILMLDLPEMPDPPVPRAFPTRVEWRKALIASNEAWVEQEIGETLRQLDRLGLNPRGGFLGQVVVHGPASRIRSALELDRVAHAILDREIPLAADTSLEGECPRP
jgi:hypothetical protein